MRLSNRTGEPVKRTLIHSTGSSPIFSSEAAAIFMLLIGALIASFDEAEAQTRPPVKISSNSGGFTGELDDEDGFGSSIAYMGDIDGDGIQDLAVGAPGDDDGGPGKGAVWILFMATDGNVKSHQKLSETEGGFINPTGIFGLGKALVNPGNLDAHGTDELVVSDNTSIHVLFLNGDGTVRKQALPFQMSTRAWTLNGGGDLDGDGAPELIVGRETGGFAEPPFVYTLSPDGTTQTTVFGSLRFDVDRDRDPVVGLGDVDNNGVVDVATGEPESGGDLGTPASGAVVIHFLRWEETQVGGRALIIARSQRIDLESGGLGVDLTVGSRFGSSLSALGDIDGDEIPDLVVGSPTTPGGGRIRGSAHVLFLNSDGTVKSNYSIEGGDAGSDLPLRDGDQFGADVDFVGDLNQDGIADIAIGAPGDDDGGSNRGAVWIWFGLSDIPPSVTIMQQSPERPVVDEDVTVSALIGSVGDISSVNVNWRRGGDEDFNATEMSAVGQGRYSSSIPDYAVSERGLEYFVSATTSSGVNSRSPAVGASSIIVASPEGLTAPVPGGSSPSSYRLVSVPIDLDEKSAQAVFEDNLGPYDVAVWRLFALESGSSLVEHSVEPQSMEPGEAFWMLSRQPGRVYNTGGGSSVGTSRPFPIRLNREWNVFGNPFAFEIPVANVFASQDSSINLWRFDGSWSITDDDIRPFEGYAVFSERPDTLWIDPDKSLENVAANASRRSSNPSAASGQAVERRMQLDALFGTTGGTLAGGSTENPSLSAYPNPFFESTTLSYDLAGEARVLIQVFDLLGRELAVLADEHQKTGRHKLIWTRQDIFGRSVAPGMYIIQLHAGGRIHSTPVMVIQ
ncbi:MAG TPA: T9SS type A sorting domain-containing protein [Rhodothermales bacterium]|nr:T9SS type A sorting domain-containing protein [Rhodothermales bacterium]